jgi:O-antigen/teichoic acid export membrane protein
MNSFLPRGSERARVVGEGLWVATGQALTLAGRFAGIRVLTGLITPEMYGEVSLLAGAAALVAGVVCTPIIQGTVRFYPDAVRDGVPGAHRGMTRRYLDVGSFTSAAILLAGGLAWSMSSGRGPGPWAYLFLSLGFLAETSRNYETGLLNAARRQAASSLWTALEAWTRPLAAALGVIVAGATSTIVLVGYAAGSLGANLLFSRARVRPGAADPEAEAAWRLRAAGAFRSFAAPLVPLGLLGWAFNLGDRYVLASAAGAEATGLYAAAYGLASMPFLALSGVLVSTLRPVLFEAVAAGDRRRERRVLATWIAATCAVGAAGVALLAGVGPWLVRLALGPEFRVSAPLLPWIGAAYAIQALQNVFETRIYARKRTEGFVVLHVASAAVAMTMYLVLIPSLGGMGAALGTVGGMTASCLASIALARLPERGLVEGGRS